MLPAAGMLAGCQQQPVSVGSEKEIVVCADSLDFQTLRPALQAAFERELPTPVPEKMFELKWAPVAELGRHLHKPRLLLLGCLHEDNEAARQVTAMLDATQRQQALQGERYLFQSDDPWRRQQRLLILAAPSREALGQHLSANAAGLFEAFEQPLRAQIEQQLYSVREQQELARRLEREYGWSLRIPHDYFIFKELPAGRFVMLRRTSPERWLFVAWREATAAELPTLAEVIAWRDTIGEKYYEGDRVATHDLSAATTVFAGRPALVVRGLWENEVKIAGGPFQCWAIPDPARHAVFLVDIAIFAPGVEKVPHLRRLEIIARSFRLRETAEGAAE